MVLSFSSANQSRFQLDTHFPMTLPTEAPQDQPTVTEANTDGFLVHPCPLLIIPLLPCVCGGVGVGVGGGGACVCMCVCVCPSRVCVVVVSLTKCMRISW